MTTVGAFVKEPVYI